MPEQALNSLLISDQLHPGFDATNLNLARLYHSLAGLTKDTVQQERYAAAARDRFSQYILLAYRGRTPPPDLQKELADYEAQCSGTNHAALPVNQNSP